MNKVMVKKNGVNFIFSSPIKFYKKDLETAADAILFHFINRTPGHLTAQKVLELINMNTPIHSVQLFTSNGVLWHITITPQ